MNDLIIQLKFKSEVKISMVKVSEYFKYNKKLHLFRINN
jgi:hypothetical protein